jgi:chaperonin GroES
MNVQVAKPLGDRVLIKVTEAETKTSGGIILPDSVTMEDVKTATVISVGDGLFTNNGVQIPMSVKIGDTVICSPYGGTEVTLSGEKYLLIRESELLMVCR